ncbi:tubulin polyglutamylase complex subunit 1 [Aplysia californica]|uniref:Tubulin polyglutamylase complex subunit 1 n=1 Tax=Aplysia californica TaxID=6500 RepID=A0ABM1W430_APLCA|nr:tubulin polyglutamylase complex subunit 1 [Aplysia californica]
MADRRKASGAAPEPAETDRQFMDKNNVNGLLKDLLTKLISNRPDDPIRFIANYFESVTLEDPANDLVNRAVQVLSLTHHSRPVFENNVRSAFLILSKHKVNKRLHGVNGTIHGQLMQALCQNIPSAVTIRLFKRLECSEHEAITYDVFRSSVFTCCVLNDYASLAANLFTTLDIQKTGKADKNLCESTLDQLRTALASSRKDVKRIMESSYNLAPEGLYLALERAYKWAMSRRQAQGFYTQDQFVSEAAETFLAKVKKLK